MFASVMRRSMVSSSALSVAGGASSSETVPAADDVSYCRVEAHAAKAEAAAAVRRIPITLLPVIPFLRLYLETFGGGLGNWYTRRYRESRTSPLLFRAAWRS